MEALSIADDMDTTFDTQDRIANAKYSRRPPSPPPIIVPTVFDATAVELYSTISSGLHSGQTSAIGYDGTTTGTTTPSSGVRQLYEPGDAEILRRIVGGPHRAVKQHEWRYEQRRDMQAVLAFLYLGPWSAAREELGMRAVGITTVLVVRDLRTAQARFMVGERVTAHLGVESVTIDIDGLHGLIAAFPKAIKAINDCLARTYRRGRMGGKNASANESKQGTVDEAANTAREAVSTIQLPMDGDGDEPIFYDQPGGKILVVCETGNERAATVVAAYLMAMYALDVVAAIQFVQMRRFCVAISDPLKHLLQSWHDILVASRQVGDVESSAARHRLTVLTQGQRPVLNGTVGSSAGPYAVLSDKSQSGGRLSMQSGSVGTLYPRGSKHVRDESPENEHGDYQHDYDMDIDDLHDRSPNGRRPFFPFS